MTLRQAELYDFKVKTISGEETSLSEYEGKVLLIVNVASKCGLTPQYDALEKVYENYEDKGLVVLGFPANDFGAQEPGTEAEIQEFCSLNYSVKFPLFAKIAVKGEAQAPLYRYLTEVKPEATGKPGSQLAAKLDASGIVAGRKPNDILWNFEKFLVNRQGEVVARFAPDVVPDAPVVTEAIDQALG
jgi:glutathione peroxidase